MLFNSYEFIFAFLPVTIAGFYLLGPVSRRWALHWLILASFFFYAWWRPLNVLLIAPSILINFVLARTLQRLVRNEKRRRASLAGLVLGLAFNVAFLGYFKYTYFLGTAINDVFGSNLILTRIILPLGISFITFQKIAFLIDVHSRRIESFTLQDYCLFVLFFPQLIAGPIVHYREIMPLEEAGSLSCSRGSRRSGSRFSSISTFRAIPTWRSGRLGCSEFGCPRISTHRSGHRASSTSVCAGT